MSTLGHTRYDYKVIDPNIPTKQIYALDSINKVWPKLKK